MVCRSFFLINCIFTSLSYFALPPLPLSEEEKRSHQNLPLLWKIIQRIPKFLSLLREKTEISEKYAHPEGCSYIARKYSVNPVRIPAEG